MNMNQSNESYPKLDSKYFIAFNLTHETLKNCLSKNSSLNPAEYRLLLQIAAAKDGGVMQSELSELLLLKPNVISQSLKILEELKLIERIAPEGEDQRKRQVFITEQGLKHIASIDRRIVEDLYENFPTQVDVYKHILEESIFAGAAINPDLTEAFGGKYKSSLALSAFELYRKHLALSLKQHCKCNLHEARVLQRLSELSEAVRLSKLSEQLILNPVNIGRAVDSLAKKDAVTRLQSNRDKKAIYVVLTNEGEFLVDLVQNCVNSTAEEFIFKNLNSDQCQAIVDAEKVILKNFNDKRRSEQLESLRPID